MAKSKKRLAEYDGLAGLAAARQGREAATDPGAPVPERNEETGKRDIQISAFIPASTYRRVKIALIEDGLTMRELIGQLLDEWLAKR